MNIAARALLYVVNLHNFAIKERVIMKLISIVIIYSENVSHISIRYSRSYGYIHSAELLYAQMKAAVNNYDELFSCNLCISAEVINNNVLH